MEDIDVRYQYVSGTEFAAFSHLVWEGLEHIGRRHHDTVTLSSLQDSVHNGSVVMMAMFVNKNLSGFSVCSLSDASDGVTTLYGQIGYIRADVKVSLAKEGFRAAEVMATRFGAGRIQFDSARKGWARVAKAEGFSVTTSDEGYRFSKEL